MQDVTQGQERVRAWPRKRGKAKTQAEKDRQERFRWVQRACQYFPPQVVCDVTEAVQGTPLLPRDLLTSMMYGRLLAFILPTGKVLWPMPAYLDVSEALDVITSEPGHMLLRGVEGWEGVPYPGGPLQTPGLTILARTAALNSQNIGNQRVFFDTVVADTQGMADLTAYGVKATRPGWYLVTGHAKFTSNVPYIAISMKNNVMQREISDDTAARKRAVTGTDLVYLNGTTDVAQFGIFANTVGAYVTGPEYTWMACLGPLT